MADVILSEIQKEVSNSKDYPIIADGTKNSSKKEQISLALRYVHNNKIHEEFIGFSYAVDRCRTVEKNDVNIRDCIEQANDGASVISGHLSGVQMRIREHVDWGTCVHCYDHRLNLVVVDSCKAVKFAADFFALLQRMYIFVSGSYVHPKWLELQKQMHRKETTIEIKSFFQTRWSDQINACHTVKLIFDVILEL